MKPRLRQFAIKTGTCVRQISNIVWKGFRWTITAGCRVAIAGYQLAVFVSKAGASFGRYLWRSLVAGIKSKRIRLIVAAILFIAWLSYLGYAALTKDRGAVISRAQAAAARYYVVAEVIGGPDGKPEKQVKVLESLSNDGPAKESKIEVENLPRASGFTGTGQYLLLLTEAPFNVVGQQRSPGNDLSGVGPPLIYRWSDDVRKQYETMPKTPSPSR